MQTTWQETQQTITRAAREESHRNGRVRVLLELIEGSFTQMDRVEKRPEVEVALVIHHVNSHGRQVRSLTILLQRIVWCEKPGTGYDAVKDKKGDEPSRQRTTTRHSAPASVRILGSAHKSNRSARKFPPTRKIVERRTPPMTTYKSRPRMASS